MKFKSDSNVCCVVQLNLSPANSMMYNSVFMSANLRTQTGMEQHGYEKSRRPRHVELCAKLLLLLIGHRVLRKLNSTGNKWAHLPDIARWLKEDDSKIAMTLLLLTGESRFCLKDPAQSLWKLEFDEIG